MRATGPCDWLVATWTSLFLAHTVCATAATATAVATAEAFGALPQVSDVVISPDGSTLAWQDESADLPQVEVFDVATRHVRLRERIESGMKLRWLHWSDSHTLLFEVSLTDKTAIRSKDRFEFFRVFALDIDSGARHLLLMQDGSRPLVTGASVLLTRTPKPHTIIMSSLDNVGGWILSLYEVDTRTGRGSVLEHGNSETGQWVVNQDGRAMARADWTPYDDVYRVMARDGHGWREIFREQKHGQLALGGLTANGAAVVVLSSAAHGRARLLALPLDGSAAHVLLEDTDTDVEEVIGDLGSVPVAARFGGARQEIRWFDAPSEQRHRALERAFPGRRVRLYSESSDHERVIAAVDSPSTATIYYLVDFRTHQADIAGEEYPALAAAALGEMRAINYAARDGTQIAAYLTLPPGRDPHALPLVVLPHGGPEARDDYAFDWWSQFLATRGYAVLQPQFRGSTGFGNDFRLAGHKQWGRLMQDDVTDAVKFVVSQGIADARRVCIVGASYGGYAALAGAAFTPELYACAASVNGISNLPELIGYDAEHSGSSDAETIGESTDPQVLATSPIKAAARVRAPVLVMYCGDDTVVPPSQSENMARALREQGKSVELVKLEGDDHWLSRGATRVRMLKELETFLASQLHD